MSSAASSSLPVTSYYCHKEQIPATAKTPPSENLIHYDLVAFLSAAQHLGIDILPLTWNALDKVGQGATGLVHESTIDASTKFAFKRSCRLFQGIGASIEAKAYRVLLQEIFLLGIPPIRQHPGIINIEGICWEVDEDGKVSPVMVFEKAEGGDLGRYLQEHAQQAGGIGFDVRLGLCHDIGNAIATLHSYNIIHGDIKPQNILVFLSGDERNPSARLIDFGYSCFALSEDARVRLPRSPTWHAPECNGLRSEFSLKEAKAADIYSFGLVCLYTLFQEDFDLDPKAENSLNKWRQGPGGILPQVQSLINSKKTLGEDIRLSLVEFFNYTLETDPKSRTVKFSRLLSTLRCDHHSVADTTRKIPDFEVHMFTHATFRLADIIFPLSSADFRVRRHIREALEKRTQQNCKICLSPASFQLSLCAELGFAYQAASIPDGTTGTSSSWLQMSGKTKEDLSEEVDYIRNDITDLAGRNTGCRTRGLAMPNVDAMAQLYSAAAIPVIQLQLSYEAEITKCRSTLGEIHPVPSILEEALIAILHRYGIWKEAETRAERYIRLRESANSQQDFRTVIYIGQGYLPNAKSGWNPSALAGMTSLAKIYHDQERYSDLEKITSQVQSITVKFLGEKNSGNVNCMSNLASAYYKQGRLAEAEKLQLGALEKSLQLAGKDKRETIVAMFNLATTYNDQGRWGEAKKLQLEGLEICKRVMGDEHPETLIAMGNLAATCRELGQSKEAETLDLEVLDKRRRMLGSGHRETLIGMGNLAHTLSEQGRLTEAEKLDLETFNVCLREFGPNKRETLIAMGNLASTYRDQERFPEAEKLEVQVVEKRTKLYGEDHRETLIGIGNLAATYRCQGRYSEAEALELKVIEKRRRVMGTEHSDTLRGMGNLALTYVKQGRFDEARVLQEETVEIYERVFGDNHPETLKVMHALLSTYLVQGRMQEAKDLQVRL